MALWGERTGVCVSRYTSPRADADAGLQWGALSSRLSHVGLGSRHARPSGRELMRPTYFLVQHGPRRALSARARCSHRDKILKISIFFIEMLDTSSDDYTQTSRCRRGPNAHGVCAVPFIIAEL